MEVRDNPEQSRFELIDGAELVGEILYRRYPDRIVLVHTEVSPALEGQGLASRLVAGALDDIGAEGLRVVPVCPFVRAYLQRHPEYAELTG
ncbi:MAG TPA: GNAT family N-acetyltransferase [Gaiellaceae bacterium]|nr:GNAT family N-acetyltransferase [Gaiellaceae bacterium]